MNGLHKYCVIVNWDKCTKWLQNASGHKWPMHSYVSLASVSPRYYCISFYEQPVLELQAIIKTIAPNGPNNSDLQGQSHTIYLVITLITSCFRIMSHFETHRLNDTKMTLKPTRAKVLLSDLLLSAKPKFQSVSMYGQLLSSYRIFWDKCIEWNQYNLEHNNV